MRCDRFGRVAVGLGALAALALVGCACFVRRPAEPAKEPTRALSDLILPTKKASRFLTGRHFVTNWLVLGPFTFGEDDFGGEHQQAAADKEFMPDEGALDGTQKAPKGTAWKEKDFKGDIQAGRADLDTFYKKIEHAAAYAVCWLHSPEAVPDAKILVGSDDYITVWVNGKRVHHYKEKRRSSEWDQDTVEKVALNKGYNHIVVKCVDVVFDWEFYFRLTDKNNRPIIVKPRVQRK